MEGGGVKMDREREEGKMDRERGEEGTDGRGRRKRGEYKVSEHADTKL